MESSPRPRFPNYSTMMSSFFPIGVRQKVVRDVIDEWATSDIDHYYGEGTIRAYVRQVNGDYCGAYCGFMGSVKNSIINSNQSGAPHHVNKWWLNYMVLSYYLRRFGMPLKAKLEFLLREISEEDFRITGMIDE